MLDNYILLGYKGDCYTQKLNYGTNLHKIHRAKFLMQRGFATPLRPSWGGGRPFNQ